MGLGHGGSELCLLRPNYSQVEKSRRETEQGTPSVQSPAARSRSAGPSDPARMAGKVSAHNARVSETGALRHRGD